MSGPPPQPSALLKAHGVRADKSFGQHFLLDLNLTGRIARAGGPLDEGLMIEIGPGPGALTVALLEAGAQRLVAVEADERWRPLLGEVAAWADGRLDLRFADALRVPLHALGPPPRRIVANLPYNVAAPLMIGWLDQVDASPDALASATVMLQAEVADRLLAAPGTAGYGRLSVVVQAMAATRRVLNAPARAFTPPPKVASTVVRLDISPRPRTCAPWADYKAVAAAAFGQRRKTLRNALRAVTRDPAALCEAAGVDAGLRAEALPVAAFEALAMALTTQRADEV